MEKRRMGFAIWGMSCVFGCLFTADALAASPAFARTEEEWERLQDDVLEYEEIPDLIEEYNVTVLNGQYEYNEFVKKYGRTKDDVANAYRDLADDLEDGMSGEDGMGMVSDLQLQLQADQLREQADDNLEDSQILYLQNEDTKDSLASAARSGFLDYHQYQLELEAAKETKKAKEDSLALAQIQYQAGAAVQTAVLDAQEAVKEQEKTIAGLEQKIEGARQELIVMCGWKGSDQPAIGQLPSVDLGEIEGIDLEAGIQTAIEKNYTLQINKRKLENAQDADNKEKLQKEIASNERQIGLSVTNAWHSLQTAMDLYELAVSQQASEERELSLAGQKWSAGMITRYEYEAAQVSMETKQIGVQTAYIDLMKALEEYRGAVNGLADAG